MILLSLGFEGAGFLYLEGDVIKSFTLCEIGLYKFSYIRYDSLISTTQEK